MEKLYIHAESDIGEVSFDTSKLHGRIGLVTTIQYLKSVEKVLEYLKSKGHDVQLLGQVLGCDARVVDGKDLDGYLYVGTGKFHPLAVAMRTGKEVFTLNPASMRIGRVDQTEVEKIMKKKKGMFAKFLSSNVIGVLMTTKSGQSQVQGGVEKVNELKEKYPEKEFYTFLCETLDFSELENFNFIECWINTMCPRIMEDVNVLNVEDVLEYSS